MNNNKLTNNNSLNIPWHITTQIINAQVILNKMYESLVEQNEINFANKLLLPYLSSIEGDTGISVNFLHDVLKLKGSNFNNYQLNSLKTIDQIGLNFNELACIYSFSNIQSNTVQQGLCTNNLELNSFYIGQTQNLLSRLKSHYFTSNSQSKIKTNLLYNCSKELGGLQNLLFNTHFTFPTFQSQFIKEYDYCTPEFKFILQSFTEFKLALYEQAIISYSNPQLNSSKVIQFSFNNWSIGKVKNGIFISFFETSKGNQLLAQENESNYFNFDLYYELCEYRNINPISQAELEWLVGFIERKGTVLKRFDTYSLLLSSKNNNFLLNLKQKLGITVNPILNGPKNAYLLHFANKLDSELIFSILYNNIVTPQFLKAFIEFSTKFNFINSLKMKTANIMPSLKDGWISGVLDAYSSFSFDDYSPNFRVQSSEDFNNIFKLLFPSGRFNKNYISFLGKISYLFIFI